MAILRRLQYAFSCLLTVLLVSGTVLPSPALWQCHHSARIVNAAFASTPSAMPCRMSGGQMPQMACCPVGHMGGARTSAQHASPVRPACQPTLTRLAAFSPSASPKRNARLRQFWRPRRQHFRWPTTFPRLTRSPRIPSASTTNGRSSRSPSSNTPLASALRLPPELPSTFGSPRADHSFRACALCSHQEPNIHEFLVQPRVTRQLAFALLCLLAYVTPTGSVHGRLCFSFRTPRRHAPDFDASLPLTAAQKTASQGQTVSGWKNADFHQRASFVSSPSQDQKTICFRTALAACATRP